MFSVFTCQFSQSVSRSEALQCGRNEKTEYSEGKKSYYNCKSSKMLNNDQILNSLFDPQLF